MDRVRAAGVVLALAALAGYVVGVYVPYPGRGLTVAGLMVGLTLWAVGESG